MIHIFKTSVATQQQAEDLIEKLSGMMPDSKCNFDLEDCDKILRVEDSQATAQEICDFLKIYSYECSELQ